MSLNILLLFYIDPSFNYSKSFLYWLLFLVLMSYMFYVNHITNFRNSESCKYKYLRLALFPSHILASKCFLLHLRVISSQQSLSDPIWCHAFLALSHSLCCMHTISWLGQSIKLLQHAEGHSGGAKLSHSLFFLTEELKEQLELDKGRLKN